MYFIDKGALLGVRAYALAPDVPSVKTDSAFMIAAYPGLRFATSWAIILPSYGLASCRNERMPARTSMRTGVRAAPS